MPTLRERIEARDAERQAIIDRRAAARGVRLLAQLLDGFELELFRRVLRFTAEYPGDASTPALLLELRRLEGAGGLSQRFAKRIEKHLDIHQRPLEEVEAILEVLLADPAGADAEEERIQRLCNRLPPEDEDD